ncbi:MAG: LytTR family DNA-binding domain-containing protein [Pedobacter sp.]|uniref:LytR/AlgR family response regulator transcription factor n=1 Tax=Pedobacter sp. TaxID=1411316 RepID=UPI002806F5C9|nr:LytTR family DNA-binding domain-containing protein [Pedobacter sp.]MDQ8004197.1 LytTR family DNA-binding domain-containing protein [Pedobacter sp.]
MKINCLIIDDNEIERDLLETYLRKFSELEIVAICEDGIQALEVLRNQKVDLVFSDIDMPDLSGIDLLKNIKNAPAFIFVTSHLEHAVESFELDALDFIAKPLSMERLTKSVNKALDYLHLKIRANGEITDKLADSEGIFFIKETKGYTRLNYDEIVYIESLGDFSKLFTPHGVHITLINLKNLEHQLPNYYFRIHKQYIVNFNKIVSVNTHEILLENDYKAPLSPSYRDQILSVINQRTLIRTKRKDLN